MSEGVPYNEPIPIGRASTPQFARRSDPATLFSRRAERFRRLTGANPLAPYLLFLADLADTQHAIQTDLPPVVPPVAALVARARDHEMPPLDRAGFGPDKVCDTTLDALFDRFARRDMPGVARTALTTVTVASPASRAAMIKSVLDDAIPIEAIAEHVLVAAGLQVHFARLAATLDPDTLVPLGDGVCPACGAAPVTSLVVDRPGAHGLRFAVCSCCSTLWNVVRIKCLVCGSTKGIGYQELDGGPGTIKAETCSECRSYVKILYESKDPDLDPVADDVASLGLDMLVREQGLARGSVNPFMVGY